MVEQFQQRVARIKSKQFLFIWSEKKVASPSSYLLPNHKKNHINLTFFSIRAFFHRHWQLTGQQGKGGDYILFHSTTSTGSQTFRHLFAAMRMRRSHIFNRNACIYQTVTRWDLPPYRITIWLIDDVMLILVCVLDDLSLGFVTAFWHEKQVDSNSHQLSSLYYKRTD